VCSPNSVRPVRPPPGRPQLLPTPRGGTGRRPRAASRAPPDVVHGGGARTRRTARGRAGRVAGDLRRRRPGRPAEPAGDDRQDVGRDLRGRGLLDLARSPSGRPGWTSPRPSFRRHPRRYEARSLFGGIVRGSGRNDCRHRSSNEREMPYRGAVAATCRGACKLSRTILSFSSSDQRRRRPVSTTSSRPIWALPLSLSIRTVLNSALHLTRWPSAEGYGRAPLIDAQICPGNRRTLSVAYR